MAYNQDEVDRIKTAIKIILEESLIPIVHEMKEKIKIGESKSESFYKQVAAYKEKIERFERAHKDYEWHNLHLVRQENAVQCLPEDFEPRAHEKCPDCLKSQKDNEKQRRYVEILREENERLKKELVVARKKHNQGAAANQQTVPPNASVSQPLPDKPVISLPSVPVPSQVLEVITIDIDSD